MRPFYQVIWRDAKKKQAGTRFFAADDQVARQFAQLMANRSKCELVLVAKVSPLEAVNTQAAAAGSSVQEKTWFLYASQTETAIRVSVPGFDRDLLEKDRRETDTDWIGGAAVLQTRNGTAARAFIKGRCNFGLRKRDQA